MNPRTTIATLTAAAAQSLKRNQMLSASGYRVITPKTPDGILQLLANDRVSALIVNNSVGSPLREELLPQIRQHCPDILILHVYHRGEREHEKWADVDIDITDPARLIVALEELLRNPPLRTKPSNGGEAQPSS